MCSSNCDVNAEPVAELGALKFKLRFIPLPNAFPGTQEKKSSSLLTLTKFY